MLFIFALIVSNGFASSPMPASEWRARMLNELSDEFCAPESFFTNCYSVSAETCQKVTRYEFSSCLSGLRMPAQVDTLTQGVRISAKLGRCVGDRLEAKFKSAKSKQESCKSAYNWN